MIEPRRLRPRRVLLAGLVAVLALSGCSNPADGNAAVTITATQPAAASGDGVPVDGSGSGSAPGSTSGSGGIVVLPPEEGPAAVTGSGSAGATTAGAPKSGVTPSPKVTGSSRAAAPRSTPKPTPKPTVKPAPTPKPTVKPAPKPKPRATVIITPAAKATGIDPLGKVTVTAKGGILVWVKVINPEGKVVGGGKINKASWSWLPELGFGRKYTVHAVSRSAAGVEGSTVSTFTTLIPRKLVTVAVTPEKANQTVGVGQPIVLKFSEPIKDSWRRKVEKLITVERTLGQPGAFRWFSRTELHWRPQQFWKSGSTVKVTLNIYAAQLSPGLFGSADGSRTFRIGRRVTSEVDAVTHQMHVYQNFKLIKSIPVSLGNDKYPTQNGVHIVSTKHPTYLMDSSTWGLVGAGAYKTNVKWATRISNSGEFVHGAPWSEYAQGKENVSHGCINMTDANAKWFMALSLQGDPVTVKRSKGPTLDYGDGFGDWTIPWDKY